MFIPVIKGKKYGKYNIWKEWVVGKPKLWAPSVDELKIIEKEWNLAREIITKGIKVWKEKHGKGYRQKNNLIKESQTQIIHIRPKAKDSKDIDKDYLKHTNNKVSISKQCFWLNKKFVYEKIK